MLELFSFGFGLLLCFGIYAVDYLYFSYFIQVFIYVRSFNIFFFVHYSHIIMGIFLILLFGMARGFMERRDGRISIYKQ